MPWGSVAPRFWSRSQTKSLEFEHICFDRLGGAAHSRSRSDAAARIVSDAAPVSAIRLSRVSEHLFSFLVSVTKRAVKEYEEAAGDAVVKD